MGRRATLLPPPHPPTHTDPPPQPTPPPPPTTHRQMLSANTRRTKVVELSTGTHRVADELRRHSLADGEGGHYSTNLDRNRYGSDNNYLFTGG